MLNHLGVPPNPSALVKLKLRWDLLQRKEQSSGPCLDQRLQSWATTRRWCPDWGKLNPGLSRRSSG